MCQAYVEVAILAHRRLRRHAAGLSALTQPAGSEPVSGRATTSSEPGRQHRPEPGETGIE